MVFELLLFSGAQCPFSGFSLSFEGDHFIESYVQIVTDPLNLHLLAQKILLDLVDPDIQSERSELDKILLFSYQF